MMRFLCLFLIFCTLSCQKPPCDHSKDDLLDDISDMAEKVEDRDDLSKNDMEAMDAVVKKLVEECYKSYENDLTQNEKKAFWSDVSAYYFRRHGLAAFGRLNKDLDVMAESVIEQVGQWMETSSGELEKWMEEFKNEDLEDLKSELKDELEEWEKKLEELIDEGIPAKSE